MTNPTIIRVIPPAAPDGEATPGIGTKLMLGHQRIRGVRSVTLRADAKGNWRATIEADVEVAGEIVAELERLETGART